MQKYRQNADFIHHDEPNNEITFSNDQYWTTHVTFLQSIPYANKTSFQLFQTFATILKEKNISAQLKKVYLKQMDHLINSRFNPIDPYSIIHFPDLLKMIEEDSFVRSDLDKFLLDSKEIKSSLENLNKIKLSGRHELYELDLTFYNYLMSLLMNMLMKPQEFLYKEGGYKPMNMKKNKNKKSEKPPQREKSPVFINLILKIKLDPAQLELIFNLKKINTTNLPPSKDETLLEICFNNFQYGISRITNNEHEFFYLWDLENLDKGLNSEIRRKDFLVRIMEEDTIEMSVVFRLKYKEKEGKLKQFLMKVTFESKNIYVDKNGDSIFFYFLTNEKFPLCYYQELCEQSYESPFSSKDFNRCNNFLVNTREMDQLMVSFLRANGCLLLEVTKEQTKNEDFKSFCEILHRKKIIKEYIPRESKRDFANQEFLKLKLEKHINMSHFLNLKKLDFKLKWLLLVLDSQDKIKLFPLSLHDFEVLCQFPASIIFQTLKKIALSNRDPKFTFENLIELMKTKNEEKKYSFFKKNSFV